MSTLATQGHVLHAESEVRLARIRDRLAATSEDERVLRVMLVLSHEAVSRQALARTALAAATGGPERKAPSAPPVTAPATGEYAQLVDRIQEVVAVKVPAGARILVVSRGDESLLVPGFDAAHFPQGPKGVYAGHYPADSEAAIAHLEECRAGGAEFLIIPATASWWLDYYGGWAQHLLIRARVAHHDEHCLIFDLRAEAGGQPTS